MQIRLALALAALLLSGCNAMTHANAKKQAEQQWKHVRARVKFQLADQQYQSRLFEEATRTVNESLALDPTQADAFVVLARANLELSRIGSAQQALDHAWKAGLESPDLIYTQGVILEQQGRTGLALERYAEAQSLDTTNVDYLVAAAECLVAVGRAEEALSLLDEHVHRLDDRGTVAVLAAHVAALMGDAEGATQRLGEAVVPPASRDMVAQELGVLLARSGRCDQAVAILQPLLSGPSPESQSRLVGRNGINIRGTGGQAASGTLGADGVARGAIRRALATCYLSFHNPSAARDTLIDYAPEHPDDTLAQLLLAKAAVATDDMLTALRAIDLLERQRGPGFQPASHPEVKLLRAVIQWRRGNLADAAVDLHQILRDHPEDVEAHCLLAEVLLAGQQPQAARVHFEHALRIDPDSTWALAGLKSPS